jgi:mannonate dehydratase
VEAIVNRRSFLSLSGAALGPVALSGCARDNKAARGVATSPAGKPAAVKMHVGCQRGPTTAERLEFFKRHGVDHICGYPVIADRGRGHWTAAELARTKELCERHGVKLSMVALPFLTSSHVDRTKRPAIMLGKDPDRQKDVDDVHKCIEAMAKVGVPALKYNMSLLGVVRTARTAGRGGTTLSAWRLKEARKDLPLTKAGRVTADVYWERIKWFVDRVVPVCEQHKVRAACHPHDPGMPPEGHQGIDTVLGTVAGLKQFVALRDSPFHGLNLCVGSVAEMLQDPAREIGEVVRYFGERKKIFNVHFRNIRGKRDDFREVFPDEGDMDMVGVARALHETGYDGMVMPDHMPRHEDDPGGQQAFAFAYGYVKGILQALGPRG